MTALNIKKQNILIIGAGSIGMRHLNNLIKLGFKNIHLYRHNSDINIIIDGQEIFVTSKWNVIQKNKYLAVIICSPTSMHVKQAIKSLKLKAHLLIEKPISNNTLEINKLQKLAISNKRFVFVAYMLRHHPLLKKIKEFITNKKYGNLISFTTKWGEYLPNWHPWEDYSKSYAAREDLGGGASLTLSHDIDLVNWIVGSPINKTYHLKNYSSNLELTAEGGSDIIYKYKNGVTGHSHFNYYSILHERYMEFTFDDANIRFDYLASSLSIFKNGKRKEIKLNNFDRNDLFIKELKDFFNLVSKNFNKTLLVKKIEESRTILNICKKEIWNNEKK
jgi:predicted dehydrogenase